jgi:hypothetical protein
MSDKYRDGVIERDRVCQRGAGRDGCVAEINVHHRRLRSQGGRDTPENRALLCGSGTTGCHGWVHAHPKLAMASGWIVSAFGPDPYDVAMWSEPRGCFVRLGCDYEVTEWRPA